MSGLLVTQLETKRLILRGWGEDLLDEFAEFYADAENAYFIGGPCDRYEAWKRMSIQIGHWVLRDYGLWALIDKASGAFAGYCGPYFPESWPEKEIGWGLARRFQGQGYASEAAIAALDFAFNNLGWTTAVSYIRPDNHPSQRLAARMGAQLEGTIIFLGKDAGVWRHPKPTQHIN
jgi:RimJ/RimL family protein N-acetyltransferase